MRGPHLVLPAVTIGFVLVSTVLPVASLLGPVFNPPPDMAPWGAVVDVIAVTVRLALAASAIAVLASTLIALGTRQWRTSVVGIVIIAFSASAAMQTTLRTAYVQRFLGQVQFGEHNLGFGEMSIVAALVCYLLPFTVPPLLAAVQRVEPEAEIVARLTGAPIWSALWHAYVHPIAPAAGAIWVLAFVLGLGAYVTPAMLGGIDDITASRYLASLLNEGRSAEAAIVGLTTGVIPGIALLMGIALARIAGSHLRAR